MSKNSTKTIIVASMSNFLTAAAIVAAGSGMSLWEQYLNLSEGDLGLLSGFSANCFSAAVGALVGGLLADHYGRRNTFSFAMLIFLLGIGLTATSTTFGQLLTGFIITGLAAGATIPASWSYIAEASEPEHRGRNIAISQFAWGVGAAVVLWISTANSPGSYMSTFVQWVSIDLWGTPSNIAPMVNVWGSRLIFASIYAIAFVVWILQRQIEESEDWKKEAETHEGRGTEIMRALTHIFGAKYIKALVGFTGMYLTWNMVASLMGFFQTHIYENIGNLPSEWANRFVVWQWVLTCVLTFWAIFIIDKWNHKKLFTTFISCGIAAWIMVALFGISNIPTLIIITILWAAQAGISAQLFFSLWGTEIFPTRYRATAVGIMFCVVRVACTFGNVGFTQVWGKVDINDAVIGSMTHFTLSALIMLALMIVATVIGYCFAPDTRGKSLDEISHELYDNK